MPVIHVDASSLNFELEASKSATSVRDYSYVRFATQDSNSYDFTPYLDSGVVQDDFYYELDLTVLSEYTFNKRLYYFCPVLYMVAGDNLYLVDDARPEYNSSALKFSSSNNVSFIIKGSDLSSVSFRLVSDAVTRATETHSFTNDIYIASIYLSLAAVDGAAYESAYDRGYDDGEIAGFNDGKDYGYSHGYNDGYDDGYEEGISDSSGSGSGTVPGNPPTDPDLFDAYNQGYAAGQSVGYNEGYSVGYDEGLSVGYENGYTAGFNAAKSSAGSGADKVGTTPELELEINGSKLGNGVTGPTFTSSVIHDMQDSVLGDSHGHSVLSPFYSISGLDFYNDTLLQGDVNCTLNMYIDKYMYEGVEGLEIVYAVPHLNNIDIYSPDGQRLGYDVDYTIENRDDEYKVIINLSIHLNDSYYGGNILIRPYITVNCFGPVLAPVTVEYGGFISSSTLKYYIGEKDIDDLINSKPSNSDSFNDSTDSFNDSVSSFESAEQDIFDTANSHVTNVQDSFYDPGSDASFLTAASLYSSMLSSLFLALGPMQSVVIISLTFTIIFLILKKRSSGG